jgi:hypothetical protein
MNFFAGIGCLILGAVVIDGTIYLIAAPEFSARFEDKIILVSESESDRLYQEPAMFHFAFPLATAMMRGAAGSPRDRARPVASGSSFPRAIEPVGNHEAFSVDYLHTSGASLWSS